MAALIDPVGRWEATFAAGLPAHDPTPWVDGHVHVVRGLPDQAEPVPTGGLDFHQILAPLEPFHVVERVANGAPFWDRPFAPGDVSVYSHEVGLADVRTTWRGLRGRAGVVSVLVPPAAVAAACQAVGLDYARTEFHDRYPAADALLDALVRRLGAEADGRGPRGRLYAEQLMATVAAHLVADYSEGRRARPGRGGLDPGRARRVLEFVEHRIEVDGGADLSLDDLAREAALSPAHFSRAFKASVGVAPYAYVLRRRVERACERLATGRYRVGEVAAALGFADPSHFTRVFRAHVGVTPSRFRRER